ncbi:MAG: [Fe-Fe] hydrogenase large subunit C-terminal domain-containing protein [Bacteroidales bacterium]|nr:[Fe-Fe] hydrogenase large subunit C-terminal domain-containing protein [Bacteroidales bacterium]
MISGERNRELVYTRRELCRTCYTCVRECPARAIRIEGGQAEVIHERCIGCGNCTRVCSQGAKVFMRTDEIVSELVKESDTAAIIAPSFPAEFNDFFNHGNLVSMIRELGFKYVSEVSFGADLVAERYKKLLTEADDEYFISSDCPSIVRYIKYYHPGLAKNLAPVVSPMVAMARVMRKLHGDDLKIVFIGPCVAKKDESREIDEAITFSELRAMFENNNISAANVEPSEFDPPLGGKGAIFPVARGLLQTAGINDDAVSGNIIAAEGRIAFQEAIREFEEGLVYDQHLELLCCKGCVMGPGMTNGGKYYKRRALVSRYAGKKLEAMDAEQWNDYFHRMDSLDLSASHRPDDRRLQSPEEAEIEEVLRQMGKYSVKDHLNCGACGYETCLEHAVAIKKGLAETEMCLPYTIEQLHNSVSDLALSNEKLSSMKQALRQSEKLAHMGQLSAGIAHELNNPLGVVIMYSNILLDECGDDDPLRNDLTLIAEQAGRCKNIVSGLLNFARKSQVNHDYTDINVLIRQGIDSVIIPDGIEVITEDNASDPSAMVDTEQMTQLITNLVKNSVDAMEGSGKIKISLEDDDKSLILKVWDSGQGIDEEKKEKIFEPFYTTKETGKGTGLGLATAYGIVKMHRGKIKVSSNSDPAKGDTWTEFRVSIPRVKE